MNHYASVEELKAQLGIADTTDDLFLFAKLGQASRQIDLCTRHQFFVTEGARTFTATASDRLLFPHADLVAVTTLATDAAGDRTYADTWALTDYDLLPEEAPYDSPPAPYWRIDRVAAGAYAFPTGRARGVQIVGKWGYYEVLHRAETLLAQAADAVQTTIKVDPGSAAQVGLTIRIDAEQLFVTDYNGTTATVARGVNGTTAAAHANDSPIDVYRYPVVGEACLLQAARLWTRKDSPMGAIGAPEYGAIRVWSQLDPDARMLLAPLRAVGVW